MCRFVCDHAEDNSIRKDGPSTGEFRALHQVYREGQRSDTPYPRDHRGLFPVSILTTSHNKAAVSRKYLGANELL